MKMLLRYRPLCWISVAAWMIASGAASAQPSPAGPGSSLKKPATGQLSPRERVLRLGDDDFTVREQAAAKLLEAGASAVAALEEGAVSNDREIRYASQRLLAAIRRSAFEERLAAFARDGEEAVGGQLPAWDVYRQLLGNSEQSRQLFVEMQRAEPQLLAAIDKGRREAAYQTNLRCEVLQREMQVYNREISLATVASLLLAAGHPQVVLPQQSGSLLYSYCYQGGVRAALAGGDYEPQVRKLLGRYIAQSDDTTAYQGLVLATQYEIKEGLEPALRILRDTNQQPYAIQFAILAIARLGDKQQMEAVEPFLADATHVTHRRVGDDNRLVAVQVRDVALAALVHLSGQDYRDYGYRHIQPNPQTVFTANSACFENDADREKAVQRWRDYRAGKLKDADKPKDASDAQG
ncbi:MAG: hypothetical protein RIC55_31075 [Pirellulaceae bacterium]